MQSLLETFLCFGILLGVIALIYRFKRFYQSIHPGVIIVISYVALIRLLIPWQLAYNHPILYQGALRHIFINVNRAWDENSSFLNLFSIRRILIVIWLAGALINAIKLYRSRRKTMIYLQFSSKDITEGILKSSYLSDSQKEYLIKHRVKILSVDNIGSPLTCGLLKTLILIPNGILFEGDELSVIVTHEIAHIKRGDLIKKMLKAIIEVVYWWFPLVSILNSYNSLATEMLTDEVASKGKRKEYVQGIISIISKINNIYIDNNMIPYVHPVTLYSNSGEMQKRFLRLRDHKTNFLLSFGILVFTVLLFISSYVFVLCPRNTDKELTEIGRIEGYYTPTQANSYIIKKDDGTFEHYMWMGGENYELVDIEETVEFFPLGAKMYDEEGNEIKWPFIHRY